MSEELTSISQQSLPAKPAPGSFVQHAKLIGFLTFLSRILGMARESVAAQFFGAGAIWSAFTVAFTIPNLFRKLFGEGALSAAFIPLYAQAVKKESEGDHDHLSAASFAVASVNLLCVILIALTILGEAVLLVMALGWQMRPDYLLAVKLTAIMLPYVLLVCGTAFLGAILQVHHRFAAITATSIVLNLFLILAIVLAAKFFDLNSTAGQTRGVIWLSVSVLIAGVVQLIMLAPSLKAVGFRFQPVFHFWTPQVRRMLVLTVPVAMGAGVLQLGVLLDKGISFFLATSNNQTHFSLFGHLIRYPMAEGAAARLNWAQFMYQFPLGIFAIAIATAIFPKLSADALDAGRQQFKSILRQGIEASLFIGLPASVGMIVVRYPAVQLLFQHGKFTASDTRWVALSTAIYSAAIWAFSLQQILNRAYYALHDTVTPLVWGAVNLAINLVVELPLIWTTLGESGMAAGTLVSFAVQSLVMLYMLSRRVGGLEMKQSLPRITIMLIASATMWIACLAIQYLPFYPHTSSKLASATQLLALMTTGTLTYFATCAALGLNVTQHLKRRPKKQIESSKQ